MSVDIAPLLNQLLPVLIAAIVMAALGLAVNQATTAWVKFRLSRPDLAALLEQGADVAVHAAEQIGAARLLKDGYESKRAYALSIAQRFLIDHGLKGVSADLILAAIERAVKQSCFPHTAPLMAPPVVLPPA